MFTVNIDEETINLLIKSEINKRLDQLQEKQTFWDTDDLKKHCRMSWNTIQDTFFHHPDFPKVKVGGKWLYPAKETQAFLLCWLKAKMTSIETTSSQQRKTNKAKS